jgi:hypothetical protein
MPKLSIAPGSTSQTVNVFIQDSSVTTNVAGRTGLVFNTASLTCYYARTRGASTAVTLATLASATAAWATGGFIEIDATNQPGMYRLDLPDAVLASGVRSAVVYLRGASNMVPCLLEIDLDAEVDIRLVAGQTASASGTVTFPNATLASTTNITAATGITLAAVTHTGAVIPTVTTTTTATNLTNLPTIPANWLTAAGIATGAITAAKFAAGAIDNSAIAGNAISAAKFAGGAIDSVAINNGAITSTKFAAGAIDNAAIAADAIGASELATDAVTEIVNGLLDAYGTRGSVTGTPSASTFNGDAGLSAVDAFHTGSVLKFTSGTLNGQSRRIASYTGSTKAMTFDANWTAAPSASDTFVILGRII